MFGTRSKAWTNGGISSGSSPGGVLGGGLVGGGDGGEGILYALTSASARVHVPLFVETHGRPDCGPGCHTVTWLNPPIPRPSPSGERQVKISVHMDTDMERSRQVGWL